MIDSEYGLFWKGKKDSIQEALSPPNGSLPPIQQHTVIEGDNLEALKRLVRTAEGAIKLIYIDPPYNTGRNFSYGDKFKTHSKNRHEEWLSFMYSRLILSRQLLREDGLMAISIGETEMHRLLLILEEVFGEENILCNVIRRKKDGPPNDRAIGYVHEYLILVAKDKDKVQINLRKRNETQLARYTNPDDHPRDPWLKGNLTANIKGGRYIESLDYVITNPITGETHRASPNGKGNWRYNEERVKNMIENNEIWFGVDNTSRPYIKRFLSDVRDGVSYSSIWEGFPFNKDASRELDNTFKDIFKAGSLNFEYPKPVELLKEVVKMSTSPDDNDIVLDFFAGSGTTGHATIELNQEDGGNRIAVLVQSSEKLAEPIDTTDGRRLGQIVEVTRERLRVVGGEFVDIKVELGG